MIQLPKLSWIIYMIVKQSAYVVVPKEIMLDDTNMSLNLYIYINYS